jgi:hypothetical protein
MVKTAFNKLSIHFALSGNKVSGKPVDLSFHLYRDFTIFLLPQSNETCVQPLPPTAANPR